jgi:hypothetical protein
MKKWIAALGACATLSALSVHTAAYANDAGDAALGGFVGGLVGGLIGSGHVPLVAPAPILVAPAAPVVVERYAPTPVVVERYGPPVSHDRGLHRGWYKHGGHRRQWDDD